jgi:hypothetical protein
MKLKPKLYSTSWHIDHTYTLGSTIALTSIYQYFWNQKLKIPSNFDFRLGFSDFNKVFFAMSSKHRNLFIVCFLKIFILLLHWSHFWRVMFWTRKVSFWGETYLDFLNNRIFVERTFENLHYTNLSKLM